jgi:hypothetical protein
LKTDDGAEGAPDHLALTPGVVDDVHEVDLFLRRDLRSMELQGNAGTPSAVESPLRHFSPLVGFREATDVRVRRLQLADRKRLTR